MGAAWLVAAGPGALMAQRTEARVRPPAEVDCPRDHLTVYIGQVQRYQRGPGRTTMRIRTDEATNETVTIAHPGSSDPSRWFLIERQPFTAADWARIEQRPGQLREGVRAAAWVCDDGRNPVVDWQPSRAP
ncbi:MAG: hypothetical protein A3E25_23575 [Burkholderiales bacterium RIFCSPHIGHO2_12_FULL_69_20]|nr:MAG: hypothetical protein A3E25_23575 [Burkholderiales bacterium RIFCSPHIGHO2_12_FULL_69_20]